MKAFRLLTVSTNTNSFGLRRCVLVAKDGEAWEIGSNSLNCPQNGKDYEVPDLQDIRRHPDATRDYRDQDEVTACRWSGLGWEIPHRLDKAPQEAVDRAWAGEYTVHRTERLHLERPGAGLRR